MPVITQKGMPYEVPFILINSNFCIFPGILDFNSAQNGCKSYGGHLITYDENSDEKFDAIDMQLKNTRKDITEVLLGTVLLDNGTLLDTNTDKLSKLTIDTPPERFCKPYCNLLLHSDISLLKTTHEIRAASQNRTFDSYACEKAGTSKILPVSTTVIALMLLSLLIYSDETM